MIGKDIETDQYRWECMWLKNLEIYEMGLILITSENQYVWSGKYNHKTDLEYKTTMNV